MVKPQVSSAKLIWNQAIISKHRITSWLFILNRNPTMDRLLPWGYDLKNCRLLCRSAPESRDHLLFLCPYSYLVWKAAIGVFGFTIPHVQWEFVLQ